MREALDPQVYKFIKSKCMRFVIIIFLIFILFGVYSTSKEQTQIIFQRNPIDTVENPYSPPLKYVEVRDEYTQLGYLKRRESRIPLFGKTAHARRDLWYYYTIIDSIKIPLTIKNKKSMSAYGVDAVYSGDAVLVEDETWTVEMYESYI